MNSPERFDASNLERPRLPSDATNLHASLTALLREVGNQGNQNDAQYCTLPIPGDRCETVTVSNYFTRIVHMGYGAPEKGATADKTQRQSIENNDAVIDIDFPNASYACFRPQDIRPEQAYLLGSTTGELKNMPQDQFVLIGPHGLVAVVSEKIAQFFADNIDDKTPTA